MRTLLTHVRRHLVAYLALVVALAATGGVAYSSIPDAGGVIHSCYDTSTGALRVIDSDAGGVCRGGETALDWNQKGQPGPPGLAGPAGSAGAAGPQGPAGLVTTYGRSAAGPLDLPEPGDTKTVATLTVPRGSYVITGKAVGGVTVPGFSCAPGTDIVYCSLLHNERRLAATIFGCAVLAGPSSDLGRTSVIPGANQQNGYQTVSANVLHTFTAASNKIKLSCLQYAGGKWPVKIANARLVAMRVNSINPLNAFRAVAPKIVRARGKPTLRAKP